jgi:hypothetical protein
MATAVVLFPSVFFQAPVDLRSWITGQVAAASVPPLDIPPADSDWIDGGSSPGKYCGDQLKGLQARYPGRKIEIAHMSEEHKSEYTPFKHDLYRYKCQFKAT